MKQMSQENRRRVRRLVMVLASALFALVGYGLIGEASADELCLDSGRTPTGKKCSPEKKPPKKKPPKKKKPPTGARGGACYGNGTCDAGLACAQGRCVRQKKREKCAPGMVRNQDTAGRCCWPGQAWAGERCVGMPTSCPSGFAYTADKQGCEAPACGPGKKRQRDGIHCCYPGQGWLSAQNKCVGVPTSCPGGSVASTSTQSCVCTGGGRFDESTGTCITPPPSGMVRVPAGKFRMGSTKRSNEKPVHEVYVSGFFIDTYEVTVEEYQACMSAGACSRPRVTHKDYKWYNHGASGRLKHPINGVNWSQAKAYCEWSGKRLPTEAEWEKAARGTDGRTYPWGNKKPSCRLAVMDDGGKGCGRDSTWPVGSKPGGVSPYGAHDMAGNVWEWTADWYDAAAYKSSSSRDPTGPVRGSRRVLRGGSWDRTGSKLRGAYRYHFAPGHAAYGLGLRCVRSLN